MPADAIPTSIPAPTAAPSAPSAPPAPSAPATLTRDQLLQLGRSGRPWEFLPAALRVLSTAPGDAALRFLAAAGFARLGLRSAAAELLRGLPEELAHEPQVGEMAAAIAALPPDEIDPGTLIETCRGNVEALAARGIDLRGEFEQWRARVLLQPCFRARDGNVVRRLRPGAWSGVSDHAGAAWQFVQQRRASADDLHFRPPYVIEGIDPPWLFTALIEATPPNKLGHQPPVAVLQADPQEFLDGLCLRDLRVPIGDPRVEFFIGPQAAKRLGDHLRERFEAHVVGEYARLPSLRSPCRPPPEEILREVQAQQQGESRRLEASVRAIYQERDRAWWAKRYASAASGEGPPLRVLMPTTRYSTYVQHASSDLAEALRDAGCEARVLLEPDHFTKFSSVAYLRQLAEWQPDLVVLINYTRANAGGMFPPQLPFVCWLQDAMWQQFDEGIGARQTEMDFLVGHLFPELFERFGFPRRNTLAFPVAVSAKKFHDAPCNGGALERHACEIAYVGHQSESPQAQRPRLLREMSGDPALQRCVEAMYPQIQRIASGPEQCMPQQALRALVEQTLREAGIEDRRAAARVLRLWVAPMADRLLRHESLAWAAEVAQRRGWRFRVYGRGWQDHPRMAPYACGEVGHGEDLRACYQAAAVHLHLTINTIRHQRLLECVLSGGLPIGRRKADDLGPILDYTLGVLCNRADPCVSMVGSRSPGYLVADHAEAMAHVAARQRYGLPVQAVLEVAASDLEQRRRGDRPRRQHADAWLLGDPAQFTFSTPQELEQLVERAVTRPAWRRAVSRSIAGAVRARCTTRHLAQRMLELVGASVQGSTDYAGMYEEYWSRPDRWQSHSFRDAGAVVNAVLKLGPGSMLDVGCGMGALVLELRRRGIDARGLDVAKRTVEEGNRQAPGRFDVGSILEIPHADESFDTVICTDVLEHLAQEDVPRALAELWRVTRRSAYLTIATRLDRDGRWHLTVRDRAWWERRLFEAGFRKHPATQQVVGYEAIEQEKIQFTAALHKLPQSVLSRYPLPCLAPERDLHMDMLRESGRRSDAHIARYELARGFVRPGDAVLDVTSGLGYGSAILCEGTGAARVIGVDNSTFAVEYARACFGPPLPTEFHCGDAADLGFVAEGSIGVVACMETLEHLADPSAFLAEIRRVLRPGGRVVVSVPNQWTDETGRDPNPHHLHVYDWKKLKSQLMEHFVLDAAYAQTAGGGMTLNDRPRKLRAIDPRAEQPGEEAEWWLAVGVKGIGSAR